MYVSPIVSAILCNSPVLLFPFPGMESESEKSSGDLVLRLLLLLLGLSSSTDSSLELPVFSIRAICKMHKQVVIIEVKTNGLTVNYPTLLTSWSGGSAF